MSVSADYGQIRAAFLTVLGNDTVLTGAASGFLASVALDGIAASRGNSIYYGDAPTSQTAFPCVTLLDLTDLPAVPDQHELPFGGVHAMLQLSVWGRSQDVGPIKGEIDYVLESAWWAKAMDTANWQFNDIDTSDVWHGLAVPGIYLPGNIPIEQHVKVFRVDAANKTI